MDEQVRYVAFLRGINVGGKNIIAKQDLLRCFVDIGFSNVRTYIQSGNILFRAKEIDVEALKNQVEQGLSNQFSLEAQALILSHVQYISIINSAPQGWGVSKSQKHNICFILSGMNSEQVLSQLSEPKTEIETVTTGEGVIFWSVSKDHLTKTTYMKLPKAPVYKQMTIRNHNTALKILELFEEI